MPFSEILTRTLSLDEAVDLGSLPYRRHITSHPFVERLRRAVHFDFFAVSGLDLEGYRFGSGNSVDTDIPPAFLDAYYGDGLIRVDPFVKACTSATTVVVEQDAYASNPSPERLVYLAQTFGVLNRTLFPISRGERVYGAVTFARAAPFTSDEIDFLKQIAATFHYIVTRPIMEKFAAQSMSLTDGEIACLECASLGMTSEEVSKNSGYTVDTVNNYIKSAIRKLGAKNRGHAIAEAIRRNLIT